MYFYVEDKEIVKEPKPGRQYVAWYGRGSMSSPHGYAHVDMINGEQVEIRAMDEAKLTRFLRTAYSRAPYIKAKEIVE
jgi:hypothetical protein